MTVPMHYHNYGPFMVPFKKLWVIVGSGPSAHLVKRYAHENEDVGVISLNASLAGIPYSTVHLVAHYEYFLQCVQHLGKPEVMFFANPMAVGFRCQDIQAMNLLDFNFYANAMGERLRFFEKEPVLENLKLRDHALYCHDTLASTALHLLSKNGVKNVFFCGIDGQEMSERLGRSKMFEDAYKVRAVNAGLDYKQPRRFDDERAAFLAFGKHLGIKVRDLSDVYADTNSYRYALS